MTMNTLIVYEIILKAHKSYIFILLYHYYKNASLDQNTFLGMIPSVEFEMNNLQNMNLISSKERLLILFFLFRKNSHKYVVIHSIIL